jgi:hypothetical protein
LKRLSTGVLAALIAAGMGLNAVAAPTTSAAHGNIGTNAIAQASDATTAAPPANFGSPPSGQIPILFNDHHVYTKPDKLKQGRVLAALVRGGTILIPLRSMFEQMGATVAYDASSKTVDVSKPGADVKVTVGKPEVVINGESRPLDVPPEIYKGHVVVPVRVISEGMGAYVQWVPDKQLVVVRYLPPTPPPPPATAPPTAPPTVAPTPTPAPVVKPYKDLYIAGDYIASGKVYDEFAPGVTTTQHNGIPININGAAEFNAFGLPWMVAGDFQQIPYDHPAGYVTTIGDNGSTFVPAFTVQNYEAEAKIGLKVADPRIYIGVGYLWSTNNAGYPKISNVGFGLEKLPDLDRPFSIYGNVWYYGNVKSNAYTDPSGASYALAYNILKGQIGVTYAFQNAPVFLEAGAMAESWKNKTNAPSDRSVFGPFVGLGLKF